MPHTGSRAAARSACGASRCSSSSHDRSKKQRKRRTLSLLDIKQAVACESRRGRRAQIPASRPASASSPARGSSRRRSAVADGRGDDARALGVHPRAVAAGPQGRARSASTPTDARAVAYYLGMVVGRAHRRQLDADRDARVAAEMATHRTKNIDAPSWLWQALVELVAVHEHAYLEHCRRYALAADRGTRARIRRGPAARRAGRARMRVTPQVYLGNLLAAALHCTVPWTTDSRARQRSTAR